MGGRGAAAGLDGWRRRRIGHGRSGRSPREHSTIDWLGRDRSLAVAEGDVLAVLSAGAYGMAMASNYNTRPRPCEVMVDDGRAMEVRARESVASLFALTLTEAGLVEGNRVLAITFLTIALTVTIQGLTVNVVARLLGLQNMGGRAVVVVGAGPLGLALAETLRRHSRPVMLIDRNTALVRQAQAAGFETREGNALDEDVMATAELHEAETMVAVTTNSEVNTLAAHIATDTFGVARAYPALGRPEEGVGERLLERVGGRIAFGRAIDVRMWEGDLAAGRAHTFDYVVPATNARKGGVRARDLPDTVVPLALIRGGSLEIVNAETKWQGGDTLAVLTTHDEPAAEALLNQLHSKEP